MSAAPRPLVFGEVLLDCFPDGERVLGGAPFNVAWHLQGLGLAPYLVTRVGDDPAGSRVLGAMATWGMDAQGVEDDPSHPTGEVRVTFVAGEPRYTILEDRAYDHIALARMPPGPVSLVYHGTLALRGARSRQALATLRCSLPAPAFVDVNLRDPWWDLPTVAAALDGARWGKLNEEELARLAGPGDPGTAARRLLSRHNLEWVFVTRGATGAFALSRRGEHHAVTPSPAAAIVDTVGAGDAFAAAVIAGLLRGWPVPRTLARAQALASAVCGLRGAIPRDPAFYAGLGDDPEVRTGGRFPQGH